MSFEHPERRDPARARRTPGDVTVKRFRVVGAQRTIQEVLDQRLCLAAVHVFPVFQMPT
jgi:hypothetical protein